MPERFESQGCASACSTCDLAGFRTDFRPNIVARYLAAFSAQVLKTVCWRGTKTDGHFAPPQPDLDCKDVAYRRFKALQPEPHHFDIGENGIRCES